MRNDDILSHEVVAVLVERFNCMASGVGSLCYHDDGRPIDNVQALFDRLGRLYYRVRGNRQAGTGITLGDFKRMLVLYMEELIRALEGKTTVEQEIT